MNIFQCNKEFKLLFIVSCIILRAIDAEAGQTNVNTGVGSTNTGIFASGEDWPDAPGGGHYIMITIHFTPPYTNVDVSPFRKTMKEGLYFLATNSFCGPITLHDATGKALSLLKPEVNSPNSYPSSYHLKAVARLSNGIAPVLLPLALSGNSPQLSFHLTDYFKLEKPGNYELKVWPRIYERISPTNDTCRRIDLPPVSINIKQ